MSSGYRMRWSVAALLIATCAANPASAREDKIDNPNPDRTWGRAAGTLFTSGKSIAVVIGISKYIGQQNGGYPPLLSVVGDADKMAKFLKDDAGFDTIYVLTDEDATRQKIEHLMTDEVPHLVGQHDRFLFYWSGHGDQMITGDNRTLGFLPLADSKRDLFSTMLNMEDIARWNRYLSAQQALFVLDACLSGLAGSEEKGVQDTRLQQLSQSSRQLVTAGTDQENVIASDKWTGSLFTDSFILGAKGAARHSFGIVSLYSLIDYIQERVAIEKDAANWSKSLTPQVRKLSAGNGAFFFTVAGDNSNVPGPVASTTSQTPESKGVDQPSPADHPAAASTAPPVQVAMSVPPPSAVTPPESPVVPSVGTIEKPQATQEPKTGNIFKTGDIFKDCPQCPQMVVVPAGKFTMGSKDGEHDGSAEERPRHSVTISAPFAVGVFHVTFEEWDACVKSGGCNRYSPTDEGWGRGRRPVINVSWNEANTYVSWLSKMTGQKYRLLSEAEREYVTRAGSTSIFWWGNAISPEQANYNGNFAFDKGPKGQYRKATVTVDQFDANPWKVRQVHGNVWDWVADCWSDTYDNVPSDGSPAISPNCGFRVIRGGSWINSPNYLRAASRVKFKPSTRGREIGFRVARSLSP